jgi:hypothetical protein
MVTEDQLDVGLALLQQDGNGSLCKHMHEQPVKVIASWPNSYGPLAGSSGKSSEGGQPDLKDLAHWHEHRLFYSSPLRSKSFLSLTPNGSGA